MIKIALGSTSEDKKNILQEVLNLLEIEANISGYNVNSLVSNQPLDENTTILGAKNRAIAALKANSVSDLGIGLEGGLVKIDNKYFLVCVSAIIDKQEKYFLGISSKLQLPKEVADRTESGEQFGQVIREFSKKYNNPEMLKLNESLITRKVAFTEAINNALLVFINKSHFS